MRQTNRMIFTPKPTRKHNPLPNGYWSRTLSNPEQNYEKPSDNSWNSCGNFSQSVPTSTEIASHFVRIMTFIIGFLSCRTRLENCSDGVSAYPSSNMTWSTVQENNSGKMHSPSSVRTEWTRHCSTKRYPPSLRPSLHPREGRKRMNYHTRRFCSYHRTPNGPVSIQTGDYQTDWPRRRHRETNSRNRRVREITVPRPRM